MTNPAKFVREVRQETNKVTWPTRRETTVSTTMVCIIATFTALFFMLADMLIASVIGWILGFGG